jgi:hypothetical protein
MIRHVAELMHVATWIDGGFVARSAATRHVECFSLSRRSRKNSVRRCSLARGRESRAALGLAGRQISRTAAEQTRTWMLSLWLRRLPLGGSAAPQRGQSSAAREQRQTRCRVVMKALSNRRRRVCDGPSAPLHRAHASGDGSTLKLWENHANSVGITANARQTRAWRRKAEHASK